jgi:hypothetical protein
MQTTAAHSAQNRHDTPEGVSKLLVLPRLTGFDGKG